MKTLKTLALVSLLILAVAVPAQASTFIDTIGDTTVEARDWSWFGSNVAPKDTRDRDHGISFVAGSNSAIKSVEWALMAATTEATMVTYVSDAGGTILATSNPYAVSGSNVYKAFEFAAPIPVTAGETYWVWSQTTGGSPLVFFVWTFCLGTVQYALAVRFALLRDEGSARLLLRGTLIYLPAWMAMLLMVTL
jgi:hypothetical protein